MPQIDDILSHMKEIDASDVYLVAGAPVTYHIYNDLVHANDRVLNRQDVELLIYEFLQDEQIKRFEKDWDMDTSCTLTRKIRRRSVLPRNPRWSRFHE